MAVQAERRVDHAGIRTSQALTIGLLLLAFILDSPPLAGIVSLLMLASAGSPSLSVFQLVYRTVKQAGLVKPDIIVDNPEPHRFSQALGGVFVGLAFVSLFAGQTALGWGLVWLVILLASANLFLGFCAGCFMYYQLNRFGVPGFNRAPVKRA